MKILVTGGTGHIGTPLVQWLVNRGHNVRVVDLHVDEANARVEYRQGDITDYKTTREIVRDQEGIIHLAAIRHPSAAPGQEIFRVNELSTFNIFQAAAEEGINRVACASSINALGFNFGIKTFDIQYFPIDEQHLTYTTDAYSFSKQITEEIAAYFWRREEISSVCLRMPYVYRMDGELFEFAKPFQAGNRQMISELIAMTDVERNKIIKDLITHFDKQRTERVFEKPFDNEEFQYWESRNPHYRLLFGYTDFWAILSVEDAAQAFEKALLSHYTGSHPLFVNEAKNMLGIESEILAKLFFPEVKSRKKAITGTNTLVSIEKAREVIGFMPKNSLSRLIEK